MPLLLVLAFIVVPIVELSVIGQVSDVLGGFFPWTFLLLIVDSVIGAVLVRREGRRAWQAFRGAIGEARWPGDEVAQGAMVLIGGTLLLTPGFVTDAVGLLLVLPPTRAALSAVVRRRVTVLTIGGPGRPAGSVGTPGAGKGRPRTANHDVSDDVIEVEVVSIERQDPPAQGSSGGAHAPT